MIDELQRDQGLSIEPMCQVLGVSKSGYYAPRHRQPSARKLEDGWLKVVIKAAHARGRGTYDPEKVQEELRDVEKVEVGLNRFQRLRRQMKIRCKQVKKYRATTDSNHPLLVALNLLNEEFVVSGRTGIGG